MLKHERERGKKAESDNVLEMSNYLGCGSVKHDVLHCTEQQLRIKMTAIGIVAKE